MAHYFGGKDGLFAATMKLPGKVQSMLVEVLSGPLATQGEELTRGYLGLWEDPATCRQMQVLARSALTNEAASARLESLVFGATAAPQVVTALAGRRIGLTLAMSHLPGVTIAR